MATKAFSRINLKVPRASVLSGTENLSISFLNKNFPPSNPSVTKTTNFLAIYEKF